MITEDEDEYLDYVQLCKSIDALELLVGYSRTSYLVVYQLADTAYSNGSISNYQRSALTDRLAALEETKKRLC